MNPTPPRHTWTLAALGLGASLLAGGCSMMGGSKAAAPADPLLGLTPAPAPGQAAPEPAAIPPIPISQATTAPASLASRSGTRPLAITDNTLPAVAIPHDQAWNLPPNPNPKVIALPTSSGADLQRTGSLTAPGSTVAAPSSAPTKEQMQAQLKERGVIGQKVDLVPEGLRLTCYTTRPDNPTAYRVYEVSAADYVAAAQAILRQIAP